MSLLERDQDTIFALSTPPGRGGIAVIRVSGPQSFEFVRKNCLFLPLKPESHRAYFGRFKSSQALTNESSIGGEANQSQEVIDEILATCFAEGKSFTGQESVEISCHGSPVIISAISDELVHAGCRLAEKGEFTYRAFMNGRLDLVQAESVLSLIESKSKSAARMASRHLQGELSKKYGQLDNDITWMLANMEAGIDFSTEDIDPFDSAELLQMGQNSLAAVRELLSSYEKGRIISEGLNVALVGRPNAGKSSLLNALTQKEHAIVTDIAGTTRDLVQAHLSIDGVMVQLTDTAGLRESSDQVEKIGIERALQAASEADLVFYLVDVSQEFLPEDLKRFEELRSMNSSGRSHDEVFLIGNKCDLSNAETVRSLQKISDESLLVSATTGENLESIFNLLRSSVQELMAEDDPVVQNTRHVEKLKLAEQSLVKCNELLAEEASPEFVSFELQCALKATKEILGQVYDDEVMDRVFKEFCIGK